jgi:hypothetical protein
MSADITPAMGMIPPGYHGLGEITFKPSGAEQGVTVEFDVNP